MKAGFLVSQREKKLEYIQGHLMTVTIEKAAASIRDKLAPHLPVVKRNGKMVRIMPVCYINRSDPDNPVIIYAYPPNTGKVVIPESFMGHQTKQKEWSGPFLKPNEIQGLAKHFMAKE